MNRYYRPSAPRYTSQFVEDRYPEDLILQAGAMKYQQKQEFAKNMGEFSALNNLIQPGYRTQELAPVVKEKYNEKLNNFISRHQKDYDSPQSLMELQQMRYEWLADPNVQLIKQDFETGNKQYDDIRDKSKTYQLDYDPNVDPSTQQIKQFRENERYKPYSPLTTYQDIPERIMKEFDIIQPEIREKVPIRVRVQDPANPDKTIVVEREGSAKVRDLNMMQETMNNLKTRLLKGEEDWSAYALTQFRDQNGNLRKPTEPELDAMILPLAKRMIVNEQQGNTNWLEDKEDADGKKKSTSTLGNEPMQLEWVPIPGTWNNIPRNKLRQERMIAKSKDFTNQNYTTNDPEIKNIMNLLAKSNPSFDKLSNEEKLKQVRNFTKENSDKSYAVKVMSLPQDVEDEMNKRFVGAIDKDGFMTQTGAASFLRGARLFDYDKGVGIDDINEKTDLAKKDGQFRILGAADPRSIATQPFPGGVFAESTSGNKSKRVIIQNETLREQQKPLWNMYSYMRSNTGIGDVSAVQFDNNGNDNWIDISDTESNKVKYEDDAKINAPHALYIRPIEDYSDGNIKVKVYAENPAAKGNENSFIKEYKLSDFNNDMDLVRQQLMYDAYGMSSEEDSFNSENSLLLKAEKMRTK